MLGGMRFTPVSRMAFARRAGVVLGVVALLALLANASLAVPLPIGAAILTAPEPDPVGAIPIAGGVPVPFVALTFSGTLTSTVWIGLATRRIHLGRPL
jgi:hypothetical protein